MKTILTLLILSFQFAAAQYIPARTKTVFNSFVEKPSIQWSAYVNDTATIPQLNTLIIQRFESGKIKGIHPVENAVIAENDLQNYGYDELMQLFGDEVIIPVYDSTGNKTSDKSMTAINFTNAFSNAVTEFYQIIYFEKGKLHSYITRISPERDVITPGGTLLGSVESISFCVNKKYDQQQKRKDKVIALGKTQKTFAVDSLPQYDMLKSVYNRNIIGAIWPDVITGKIKMYEIGAPEPMTNANITSGIYKGSSTVMVPLYDSTGSLMGTKAMGGELTAASFDKITLIEDWYYDETKDIILCKIPEAVIFKNTSEDHPAILFRLQF